VDEAAILRIRQKLLTEDNVVYDDFVSYASVAIAHQPKGAIEMSVAFADTYTDPPPRLSAEPTGGAGQDLFQRVENLLDRLPEPGPPEDQHRR
jgi:hypothetical protein